MDDLSDRIARTLTAVLRGVEEALGVSVPDDAVGEIVPAVAHVFLHECLHEVLAAAVPWAGEVAEADPLLDEAVEVVVLVLESSLAPGLGLPAHSSREVAAAIAEYPVPLSPTDVEGLQALWESGYRPSRDLARFAERVLGRLQDRRPRWE